jgi:hypothetical protein
MNKKTALGLIAPIHECAPYLGVSKDYLNLMMKMPPQKAAKKLLSIYTKRSDAFIKKMQVAELDRDGESIYRRLYCVQTNLETLSKIEAGQKKDKLFKKTEDMFNRAFRDLCAWTKNNADMNNLSEATCDVLLRLALMHKETKKR